MALIVLREMLGVFTKLPRDVRDIIYTIRGVIFKCCVLNKSFLRDVKRVLEVKRLSRPISGQELCDYLLYLNEKEKSGELVFTALLSQQNGIRWQVRFSLEGPRALDRTIIRTGDAAEHAEEPENATAQEFERLCYMLVESKEILLSYHLAIYVLFRRFPKDTNRLVVHNVYCLLLREKIDRVFQEYQLPHQCVFLAELEPDSFVVKKYVRTRPLSIMIQEDLSGDKYQLFMLKLVIIRTICVNDNVLLELSFFRDTSDINIQCARTMDHYSRLLTILHTPPCSPNSRAVTASNILILLREKISTISVGEEITYHLRLATDNVYRNMYFSCRHVDSGVEICDERQFVPIGSCARWIQIQNTLADLGDVQVIISSSIAEEICPLEEYSIYVKQKIGSLLGELGITLEDFLERTEHALVHSEETLPNRLMSNTSADKLQTMRLLCTYLHTLVDSYNPGVGDIEMASYLLLQTRNKLGMYTFMQ